MNCEEIIKILESVRNIPYPELECINANNKFISLLFDTYSGMHGELTAILQYTYESIMFNNEEISKIVKQIAIMEMHHLSILGEMLKKLGRPPVYKSGNETLWNAKNINYVMRNVEEVMKNNIQEEHQAIRNYESLIECTNDECIKKLMERIILDEKSHIEVFNAIMQGGL